jgi:hypothetical protein
MMEALQRHCQAMTSDPTADPNKAWPADRRNVNAGTLTVQQIEPEPDGPCRDINYDPTVLPAGITTSDDPFPAARSAAYSRSYNSRAAESSYYPRTATGESLLAARLNTGRPRHRLVLQGRLWATRTSRPGRCALGAI